jgi:uncharacterized membrane protein
VHKGRLEAFSDGVIAIVITIMVLEMKVPHGADFASLGPLLPVLSSYVLSFVYIGIYWNNHHHLMQVVRHVSGPVLWANLHLLFWLSLLPFATHWMGETHFAPVPTAAYGVALLWAAIAYAILVRALLACHEADSPLARAVGSDFKGKISLAVYLAAIPLAFVDVRASGALYVAVAIMWLTPDRRMERVLRSEKR